MLRYTTQRTRYDGSKLTNLLELYKFSKQHSCKLLTEIVVYKMKKLSVHFTSHDTYLM